MSGLMPDGTAEEISNSAQLLGSNTDNLYTVIDRDK